MDLYLANCSKQDFRFTYMLPENPRPFMDDIRAGAQVKFSVDQETLDQIIKQHEPYGLMHINKIKKGFGGLAYSIDKVINIHAIENGFSQKDQESIDRALEAQKITAVSADQIIASKAQEMGLRQTSALEVEVIEDKKHVADNEPKMNQTIEVVRDGLAPSRTKGRPRKNN